jgi:hypothetical protein
MNVYSLRKAVGEDAEHALLATYARMLILHFHGKTELGKSTAEGDFRKKQPRGTVMYSCTEDHIDRWWVAAVSNENRAFLYSFQGSFLFSLQSISSDSLLISYFKCYMAIFR